MGFLDARAQRGSSFVSLLLFSTVTLGALGLAVRLASNTFNSAAKGRSVLARDRLMETLAVEANSLLTVGHSATLSSNGMLRTCVHGGPGRCHPGTHEFTLMTKTSTGGMALAGTTSSPVFYDDWGKPCVPGGPGAGTAANCALIAIAQFRASCALPTEVTCAKARSIEITFSVRANSGYRRPAGASEAPPAQRKGTSRPLKASDVETAGDRVGCTDSLGVRAYTAAGEPLCASDAGASTELHGNKVFPAFGVWDTVLSNASAPVVLDGNQQLLVQLHVGPHCMFHNEPFWGVPPRGTRYPTCEGPSPDAAGNIVTMNGRENRFDWRLKRNGTVIRTGYTLSYTPTMSIVAEAGLPAGSYVYTLEGRFDDRPAFAPVTPPGFVTATYTFLVVPN